MNKTVSAFENPHISRRHVVRMVPAVPIAFAAGSMAGAALAEQPGPSAQIVLRADLTGQGNQVQETVVTALEFPPGQGAPRHMHPGAQELLYVIEGMLTVEVDDQETKSLKKGEVALIPAEIPHLARNDSPTAATRALAIHSRADKTKPLRVDLKAS